MQYRRGVLLMRLKISGSHSRFGYLAASLKKVLTFQPKSCPACWSGATLRLKTKHLITSLRLCTSCRLMFRYPKDDGGGNFAFYPHPYRENHTPLPDSEELGLLLENNFSNTGLDFSLYLKVMQALAIKPRMKVLDFGCSWGYGTYQLCQAGYDAVGFEIRKPQAQFGQKCLGLTIFRDPLETATVFMRTFDLILASHVLEHLPYLHGVFEWLEGLMKPGALLIAFCPNGNLERARNGAQIHQLWGQKRPLLLDASFLQTKFAQLGWTSRFASSPYDLNRISRWPEEDSDPAPLLGEELLAVAWKPKSLTPSFSSPRPPFKAISSPPGL
uniref:Class I SAM-dependent methyltransferase n=1 Tax=Desulfobacca acetoxidans TaxID=60893 RepID=A0A7C3SIA5_9BACT